MRNTCKIACILLLNILVFQATGQNIPTKPNPPRLVNDYTHTLTEDQRQALERKLVAIDDSTSTQLAVVIISSLEGQDIGDYTVELGRAWGIGGKEFNNGIVLLIAIKDRKLHIATGYGLEGALTDITSKHIIDDIISPSFKIGDFYRGIDEGTDAIIKAVKGEYHAPRKASGRPKGILKFITIFIIILIYLISKGSSGKGGSFMSRRGTRGLAGPLFWGSIRVVADTAVVEVLAVGAPEDLVGLEVEVLEVEEPAEAGKRDYPSLYHTAHQKSQADF